MSIVNPKTMILAFVFFTRMNPLNSNSGYNFLVGPYSSVGSGGEMKLIGLTFTMTIGITKDATISAGGGCRSLVLAYWTVQLENTLNALAGIKNFVIFMVLLVQLNHLGQQTTQEYLESIEIIGN